MTRERGLIPAGRDLDQPGAPRVDPEQTERVVVLYYGRDGSVVGYELTGLRDGSINVERDVEAEFDLCRPPLIVDTKVTLTVEASRCTAIIRTPQEAS